MEKMRDSELESDEDGEDTETYEDVEEEEMIVEENTKRIMIRVVCGKRGVASGNNRRNCGSSCCQADECSINLSFAKSYHRRHKVCERHFKAPVVLVGGIRQRFCQQCSRFHEISEFDNTKRSCRNRLAGHNLRRRKPQSDLHAEDEQKPKVSKVNSNTI